MQFNALIEEWSGECTAYFRELPGCYCSRPSCEEMLRELPGAVASYLKWLKVNDITVLEDFDGKIEIAIAERLAVESGHAGPLFQIDLAPPDDTEIDNALNVAAAARAALLELYEEVPPAQQTRRLSAQSWSLSEHMQHLLENEGWYVSRLDELPLESSKDVAPVDIAMTFFENAMDYELVLRALTSAQRQQIYTLDDEQWTAAKVLRRMTGHLREHYPWMAEIAGQLKAIS